MINYELVEIELNERAHRILLWIKKDYYEKMSPKKQKVLDDLIKSDKVVSVDKGVSTFNDKTLAHGGRTLRDGKIHFYPDVRNLKSDVEAIEICARLLPHECFHYFIQPDEIQLDSRLEEMVSFYAEGLVEKEARKFCGIHEGEIAFEKANYGFNINFVNLIQDRLNATSYETIFSEEDYLRSIGLYGFVYRGVLKKKEDLLEALQEIAKEFPKDLQESIYYRMKTIVLQDGNANVVRKKLMEFEFITEKSIEKLGEEVREK